MLHSSGHLRASELEQDCLIGKTRLICTHKPPLLQLHACLHYPYIHMHVQAQLNDNPAWLQLTVSPEKSVCWIFH